MTDRPKNDVAHPRETLPRSVRIRSRRDFERVFDLKIRASDAAITLYGAPSDGGSARLGIAAGRRLGNAVVRNRTKRLVREAFRRIRHKLPPGTDWVVVPKTGSRLATQDLQISVTTLAKRLTPRIEACRDAIQGADPPRGPDDDGGSTEQVPEQARRRNLADRDARKKKAPGA